VGKISWSRERELELARLLKKGITQKLISEAMDTTVKTVHQKAMITGFHHLTDEEHRIFKVFRSKSRERHGCLNGGLTFS